jgi:hypothetical protein
MDDRCASGEHHGGRRLMTPVPFANLVLVLCSRDRIAGWSRPRPTFFARH